MPRQSHKKHTEGPVSTTVGHLQSSTQPGAHDTCCSLPWGGEGKGAGGGGGEEEGDGEGEGVEMASIGMACDCMAALQS
jgi:hypothetical protein